MCKDRSCQWSLFDMFSLKVVLTLILAYITQSFLVMPEKKSSLLNHTICIWLHKSYLSASGLHKSCMSVSLVTQEQSISGYTRVVCPYNHYGPVKSLQTMSMTISVSILYQWPINLLYNMYWFSDQSHIVLPLANMQSSAQLYFMVNICDQFC